MCQEELEFTIRRHTFYFGLPEPLSAKSVKGGWYHCFHTIRRIVWDEKDRSGINLHTVECYTLGVVKIYDAISAL